MEFIDFHCHSSMKPFSKSFGRPAKVDKGKNDLDDSKKWSIWYKTRIKLYIPVKLTHPFLSKLTTAK